MIGVDIIKISRIQKLVEKHGIEFVQKMIGSNAETVESLAGHFAAKEAYAKAMGTGLSKNILKNSFVEYNNQGRPFLNIKGKRYIITISHDGDYAIAEVDVRNFIASEKYLKMLNFRSDNSNKSSFGKLGLIAGNNNMPGSAMLATKAAFRSGVGYVYLFSSEKMLPILQIKATEAIVNSLGCFFLNKKFDAIAIGPGIGFELGEDIKKIFKYIEENKIPTIVDADGFYYLKKYGLETSLIITPHPKEAARLLDLNIDYVLKNREVVARELARKYKAVCILKGSGSLIVDTNNNIIVNATGSNALATAGTGDVLTGIIGAFLAQGMGIMESAMAGAYFHGLAADLFSNKYSKRSFKAEDLIDMLKYVFRGEDFV